MALIKVKLQIKSVIKGVDEPEPEITEEECVGVMKCAPDGKAERISYKAVSEDGNASDSLIELFDGAVRLSRHGAIESTMLFEVGVKHESIYTVTPFSFDLSVEASRITQNLCSLGGELILDYLMNVGAAERSCSMKVRVTPI